MYTKTQTGNLMIIVVGLATITTGTAGILTLEYIGLPPAIILFSISGILLFCLMTFSTLNVTVNQEFITTKYGYGLVKKKIALKDIDDSYSIEYMGGHGFGPRKTVDGWFFNVKNSGAVRLDLSNGKTFFIGTAEPRKLIDAIKTRM